MSIKDKLLDSANKNIQKGQIARAIKDYQRIAEIDPQDVRCRQKLAELFSRDNRIPEALDAYEAVAKHYADSGFYLKAIAVCKQMQKLDPARVAIYHRLAELNVKQGLIGNALSEYKSLVDYYLKVEMLPEALNVLLKMRDLEPENLNVRVKVAENYARSGRREKAWEEFQEVLSLLNQKNDPAKILKLYQIFLPLFAGDAEMERGYAQALIQAGKPKEALDILERLRDGVPENPELLLMMAHALEALGDHARGKLAFQRLLQIAPRDLEYCLGFVRQAIRAGDCVEALGLLEEWKEEFFDAGLVAELKGFYQDLSAALPGDERAQRTLQAIYEVLGEGDQLLNLISSTDSGNQILPQEPFVPSAHELLDESVVDVAASDLLVGEEDVIMGGQAQAAEPVAGKVFDLSDFEEVSLEFLEAMHTGEELCLEDPSLEPTAEPGPESPLGQQDLAPEPPQELELELELDFEDLLAASGEALSEESAGISEIPEEVPQVPAGPGAESGSDFLLDFDVDEELSFLDQVEETSAGSSDVEGLLQEARLYFEHELLEEAHQVCERILEQSPGHGEALRMLEGIGGTQAPEQANISPVQPAPSAAAALAGGRQAPKRRETRVFLDGFFSDETGKVESIADLQDTESHYSLGIAYKEMGLLDDAVVEFEKASVHPARRIDCLTLKGVCLVEKGDLPSAEETFNRALEVNGLSDGERISLHYELGLLLERSGRDAQALDHFQAVAEQDPFFRDVGDKTKGLEARLGMDGDSAGGRGDSGGKKGRVSYI